MVENKKFFFLKNIQKLCFQLRVLKFRSEHRVRVETYVSVRKVTGLIPRIVDEIFSHVSGTSRL